MSPSPPSANAVAARQPGRWGQFACRVRRRPISAGLILFFTGCVGFTVAANTWIPMRAHNRLYSVSSTIPANDIGLVLGSRAGTLYFQNRINAAADLYKQGKVRHLLVSGDNHVRYYDEPTDMKDALIQRGVPADAITCDYAGFRTLDSILRSRDVFGATSITIISQKFHNERAIAIARRHGIDAIGFNAEDVPAAYAVGTSLREILARDLAVLDLYLLNRRARFPGPPEPIMLGSTP